ncbi:hypothetical protein QQP08_012695 [Theobroma cacao]|nr:hypothetical protein QQP08_012695 [Theobroma cacao]
MDEYDDGMLISQEGYAKEVLNKFKMLHCNPWNLELKLFTVVKKEKELAHPNSYMEREFSLKFTRDKYMTQSNVVSFKFELHN